GRELFFVEHPPILQPPELLELVEPAGLGCGRRCGFGCRWQYRRFGFRPGHCRGLAAGTGLSVPRFLTLAAELRHLAVLRPAGPGILGLVAGPLAELPQSGVIGFRELEHHLAPEEPGADPGQDHYLEPDQELAAVPGPH